MSGELEAKIDELRGLLPNLREVVGIKKRELEVAKDNVRSVENSIKELVRALHNKTRIAPLNHAIYGNDKCLRMPGWRSSITKKAISVKHEY